MKNINSCKRYLLDTACKLLCLRRGLSVNFFIFPDQTGTATSSPTDLAPFPTIINVMLWMKKEAYEESTIKATAKNLQEATQLIENGFEYVTEMDRTKLFRKRK